MFSAVKYLYVNNIISEEVIKHFVNVLIVKTIQKNLTCESLQMKIPL